MFARYDRTWRVHQEQSRRNHRSLPPIAHLQQTPKSADDGTRARVCTSTGRAAGCSGMRGFAQRTAVSATDTDTPREPRESDADAPLRVPLPRATRRSAARAVRPQWIRVSGGGKEAYGETARLIAERCGERDGRRTEESEKHTRRWAIEGAW